MGKKRPVSWIFALRSIQGTDGCTITFKLERNLIYTRSLSVDRRMHLLVGMYLQNLVHVHKVNTDATV